MEEKEQKLKVSVKKYDEVVSKLKSSIEMASQFKSMIEQKQTEVTIFAFRSQCVLNNELYFRSMNLRRN